MIIEAYQSEDKICRTAWSGWLDALAQEEGNEPFIESKQGVRSNGK